jgi:hypothetical protein
MRAFLGLVVIASIAGWLVAQEQLSSNTARAAYAAFTALFVPAAVSARTTLGG